MMPLHAAWPTWMTFVLIVIFMGPMLRMIFGRIDPHSIKGGRWRRGLAASEDIGRLDAAISERDTVIEDLQRRINEMESRLDFAERLLAERRNPAELPVGER